MEKFIQIGVISIQLKNYFGAKAIYAGVSHPAVSRMKKTFSELSRFVWEEEEGFCFVSNIFFSFSFFFGFIFIFLRETKLKFNKLQEQIGMDTDNGSAYRYNPPFSLPPSSSHSLSPFLSFLSPTGPS